VNTRNRPYRTCLLLVGIWLAVLASACGGQVGNAIKSSLPSLSARPTVAQPTADAGGGSGIGGGNGSGGIGGGGGNGSGGIGGGGDASADASTDSPTTEAPTSPPTTQPPTTGGGGVTIIPTIVTTIVQQTSPTPSPTASPAASESSSFPWVWVILGALVVILLVALIARSSGRRGAERTDWRTRSLHAYAQGAGLVDALTLETSSPPVGSDQEWVQRWSDLDRRADALSTELHEIETGSPDPQTTQIVTDLGSSLSILRTSLRSHAQAGPGTPAGPLTDRVQEFERALRTFRERLG